MKGRVFSDFLFGTADFSASQGFADEFISECAKRKILIHNLIRKADSVSGYVHFPYISSITEAAAKSGMNLTIDRRRGIPHIIYRYRKRFGIPVGLLAFVIISTLLYSVIWSIDISPTEHIPTEDIVNILEINGVRTGVFSDTVDCKEAEYLLYENFDGISWVNVRIAGTRMFVDISEVKVRENYREDTFTNIIAAKDGEIVNAEIFRGTGKIYPGTAVVKGDLLISGIIEHRDGSVKFVDSEGEIFARTNNFISSSIPRNINVYVVKSCKDIYFPVFFGITLSEIADVKYDCFTNSRYFIQSNDVVLPVGLIRKHGYTLEPAQIKLNDTEAALLCFRDFSALTLKLYNNAEILESDITLTSSDTTEIYGNFLAVENIALKKEFTVEEN